jgi:hypothetical protein
MRVRQHTYKKFDATRRARIALILNNFIPLIKINAIRRTCNPLTVAIAFVVKGQEIAKMDIDI